MPDNETVKYNPDTTFEAEFFQLSTEPALLPMIADVALTGKEIKIKQQKKKEAKLLAEVNQVIAKLQDGPVKIGAKTGTSGKIFGSVTSLQLARAIRDQKGYEIDRKRISIADEVKELGIYKAVVDFGNGKTTELEFVVGAE